MIKGEPEFACLKPLLAAVDRGEIALVESTAILAEVQPAHGTDPSRHARDTVRALLESPATQLLDVSTAVARKAGELRGKHGLKTWDAVHLATAILANVYERTMLAYERASPAPGKASSSATSSAVNHLARRRTARSTRSDGTDEYTTRRCCRPRGLTATAPCQLPRS